MARTPRQTATGTEIGRPCRTTRIASGPVRLPGPAEMSPGKRLGVEERGVPTWMAEAGCKGKGRLFFPAPSERLQARRLREGLARGLCHTCPVLEACRHWARVHGERGFWGAESEEQRASAGFMPFGLTFGANRR